MPKRFKTITPPLPETFSFRDQGPCLVEDFAESATPPPEECRFREMCDRIAVAVSEPLRLAYDEAIRVTLAEPSGNIVSRSENNFNRRGDHARLSLRKHFYEYEFPDGFQCRCLTPEMIDSIASDPEIPAVPPLGGNVLKDLLTALADEQSRGDRLLVWRNLATRLRQLLEPLALDPRAGSRVVRAVRRRVLAVLGCHAIWRHGRCAKYLGFADIRPGATQSPIAMALLAPPRSLRHDPDVFVITGEYGCLFGAPSFSATVYSMFDPEDSGAACSQSCLIMTLGILSDRGVKVLGSYDLTYLGKEHYRMVRAPASPCLARSADAMAKFRVRGLNMEEMRHVLNRPEIGAQAHYFHRRDGQTTRRLVARLIEAYLLARYPIILPVEASAWARRAEQREIGHTVLVMGMRRASPVRGGDATYLRPITELVLHDPGSHPFVKRPLRECLDASVAWSNYQARENNKTAQEGGSVVVHETGGMIELLVATEHRIVRSGAECVEAVQSQDPEAWQRFIQAPEEGGGPGDYRLLLVNRHDVLEAFAHSSYDEESFAVLSAGGDAGALRAHRIAKVIQSHIATLPATWYWSVACYENDRLMSLWLFNATASDPQWDRVIDLAQTVP